MSHDPKKGLAHQLQSKTFGLDMRTELIPEAVNNGLCGGCQWSFIYKYKESNKIVTKCNALPGSPYIHGTIEFCNNHHNKTQMDLVTMVDVAVLIDPNPTKVGIQQGGRE